MIVVASVSCIFGLGSPEKYDAQMLMLKPGRDDRPRRDAAQAGGHPVHAQRPGARPRHLPRPRARRSRSSRPTPRPPTAPSSSATRSRPLQDFDPLTGEVLKDLEHVGDLARHPLRDRPRDDRARGRRDPRRARGAHQGARGRGQAARVAPAAPAHPVRHGDAARARLLQRDRELLAHPRRPRSRASAPTACSTSSRTTSSASSTSRTRPCPQIGGMYEGDRSRKQTLVDYGFRLPSALDNRPQTFDEFLQITNQMVFVSATPGDFERTHSVADRRADRAAHGHHRPRGRRARDQEPDRRPDERDPRAHRGRRAHAGHHADQEDVRGPDRLPDGVRRPGPLPALGGRHARADPDHPRAAARRVRRAGGREPAARGPRPARGVAGGDPRRRQGGLPARRDLADPDDRPRRAQHPRAR